MIYPNVGMQPPPQPPMLSTYVNPNPINPSQIKAKTQGQGGAPVQRVEEIRVKTILYRNRLLDLSGKSALLNSEWINDFVQLENGQNA